MKLIKKILFQFGDILRCGSVNGPCSNCGWVGDVDRVVVSAGGLILVMMAAASNAGVV